MQRLALSALTLSLFRPSTIHRGFVTMNGLSASAQVPTSLAAVDQMTLEQVEARYRPFRAKKNAAGEPDWVESLELDTVQKMAQSRSQPVRILVLYGSLRERCGPLFYLYVCSLSLD